MPPARPLSHLKFFEGPLTLPGPPRRPATWEAPTLEIPPLEVEAGEVSEHLMHWASQLQGLAARGLRAIRPDMALVACSRRRPTVWKRWFGRPMAEEAIALARERIGLYAAARAGFDRRMEVVYGRVQRAAEEMRRLDKALKGRGSAEDIATEALFADIPWRDLAQEFAPVVEVPDGFPFDETAAAIAEIAAAVRKNRRVSAQGSALVAHELDRLERAARELKVARLSISGASRGLERSLS